LRRTVHAEAGDRIQYDHRQVTLMVLPGAPPGGPAVRFLLDPEPQRPGEDAVETALRLLARARAAYPRAFDVVLGDGLYAQAPVFNLLLAHRKHARVALKDERRNLYQAVAGFFALETPQPGRHRSRACWWWDFPDVGSWPQVHAPGRVMRSVETSAVRRPLDQQDEPHTSDWIWATTLPPTQVPVDRVVRFGRQRWDIEHYGFNELVNAWHSDHVFKHDSNAIECFLLVAFLAYNLFHAFFALTLKPAARRGTPHLFWARRMAAALHWERTPHSRSP
jgi:hypothetical protein